MKLVGGLSIRFGSGFHVWTESGEALYQALDKKAVTSIDLFKRYSRREILDRVIDNADSFKENDRSGRSLEKIRKDTWIGECTELATLLALENNEINAIHTSKKLSKCPYDVEALELRLEIKAFKYDSSSYIQEEVRFSSKRTYENISQQWNSFDIYLPVLWKDDNLNPPTFSNDLTFCFWKMIDSRVFWSKLKMFDESFTLDQKRACSDQMLRNFTKIDLHL